MVSQQELEQWLHSEAAADYKKFSAGLTPGCHNMLGVRIPVLRKKAKELARGDWRGFLAEAGDVYFEETMLAGMVIGYARMEIEERIEYFRRFIPRIQNWSVNDGVCSTIKLKPSERERFWDFLMEYKNSQAEYEVRVVAVMLMNQYLLPDYIESVLDILDSLCDEDYYASMGIAWAVATAYAKFPGETKSFLEGNSRLSDETYNRAIQKIIESYRVPEEDKKLLRAWKRRK